MALPSRRTYREGFAQKLDDLGIFEEVLEYLPKKLSGKSPIATVESAPANRTTSPADEAEFKLIVGLWVRRSVAADAEDLLDDLEQDVAELVATWDTAEYYQESSTDYVDTTDDQGGQYRVEWLFIRVTA